MTSAYLETISLMERLHRQGLDVVRRELDRSGIQDINSVQASLLFNMGEAEDGEMSVGELTTRGCYLGSNVSYNLKKLVEAGYVTQERSPYDRRSVQVRLSQKGIALRRRLAALHQQLASELTATLPEGARLDAVNDTLRQLETFWRAKVA